MLSFAVQCFSLYLVEWLVTDCSRVFHGVAEPGIEDLQMAAMLDTVSISA